MNLLPLIERELRVAARRPLTWWSRVAIGVIAIFIGLAIASAQAQPAQAGAIQFAVLSVAAFVLMLLSGLRYAAFPLAEENREGTLPLLLLTPLHRREIILGKVAAGFIESLAGLLVFMPVLMLPLLSGGVEWQQVALVALTLCATMIVSLVCGNFVGAVRDHEMKAMLRAALMLVLLCAPFGWMFVGIRLTTEIDLNQRRDLAFGLIPKWWHKALLALLWLVPGIVLVVHLVVAESVAPMFFTGSPAYLLALATGGDLPAFLLQFVAVGWFTLVILELASIRLVAITGNRNEEEEVLTHYVQPSVVERSEGVTVTPPALLHQAAGGRAKRKPRRLGDDQPLLWLLEPPEWMSRIIWFGFICSSVVVGGTAIAGMLNHFLGEPGDIALAVVLVPFTLVTVCFWPAFCFLFATQAGRLFAESRRSGSIELLLVTPHFREVALREQWRSLRELVRKPVLLFLAVAFVGGLGNEFSGGTERVSVGSVFIENHGEGLLHWLLDAVDLILTLLALGWFAMWRAWASPRPMLAPVQAFLMAAVVPFVFLALMGGVFFGLETFGYGKDLAGYFTKALGIAYSLLLIRVARGQLNAAFAAREAPPPLRRQ